MGFVWARFSEAGRTVALCHTAKPLGQKIKAWICELVDFTIIRHPAGLRGGCALG